MAHQHPPGRGGAHSRGGHHAAQSRTANAYVNLFRISLDRMGKTVYQYDGKSPHFFPFTSSSHQSPVGQWALVHCLICADLLQHSLPGFSDIVPEILAKRRIFEIVNSVQLDNPQIFTIKPAFDGKKNFFSFSPLLPGGEGVFTCTPEGAIKEYTVTIRLVAQVESEYLSPSNDPDLFLMWLLPRFVKKLIGGSPSEAATNVSNILQVVISQHSNM
jgi:hypothetical protein